MAGVSSFSAHPTRPRLGASAPEPRNSGLWPRNLKACPKRYPSPLGTRESFQLVLFEAVKPLGGDLSYVGTVGHQLPWLLGCKNKKVCRLVSREETLVGGRYRVSRQSSSKTDSGGSPDVASGCDRPV